MGMPQDAGAPFAFTGAVYLAMHGSSGRWLAPAIGFTQFARTQGRIDQPKSYRRGIIRGLLFMPATIGNMIWGDTFLRV
jgi:hypothetical protein